MYSLQVDLEKEKNAISQIYGILAFAGVVHLEEG